MCGEGLEHTGVCAGSCPRRHGKQGGPRLTPALPQGTPADVLYKGTITRIIGEDSPGRLDRGREDSLLKAHVIYEGKKGHVLSYEGEFCCWRLPGAGGQAGASLPAVHRPLLPRGDAPSEGSHGTREESWSLAGHVYFLGAKHMPGGLEAQRLESPLRMHTRDADRSSPC